MIRADAEGHNHILRGDEVGCPACDRREGRTSRFTVPADSDYPKTPAYVLALPEVLHRIRDGRAVCDGGRGARCHWYPGDECDHESWPCGHEYVAHDQCWAIAWLDQVDLGDSAEDDAWEHCDDETLAWADGVIEYSWQGDYLTWTYTAGAELVPGSSSPSACRESDVPLWDDEIALAEGAAS